MRIPLIPMCRNLRRGRCSFRNGLFGLVQVQPEQGGGPDLGKVAQEAAPAEAAAGSSSSSCCAAGWLQHKGCRSSPARHRWGRYRARSLPSSLASLGSIPSSLLQQLALPRVQNATQYNQGLKPCWPRIFKSRKIRKLFGF